MYNKILLGFKKDVYEITKYYKKLINRTKKNQIIGSINEWIVDNYYVVLEQKKYTINDYKSKFIMKIKRSRKKEIYFLVLRLLKEKDFNLNMDVLFDELSSYQIKEDDYFSYAEVNYIYTLISIILINELSNLSQRLNKRLNAKDSVDRLFNEIEENLKNDSNFDINDYIILNKETLNDVYYIEQLNYKLKELGEPAEDIFIKLNELLLEENKSLKGIIKNSHNRISKDNFLIMNIFNALKKISKYEMDYLYKKISYTEKTLISEKVNIYNNLYDNNKDEYRRVIINESKKRKINEYEYSKEIVNIADKENKHIGWYLFKEKNYDLRSKIYVSIIILLTFVLSCILSCYLSFGALLLLLVPVSVLVIEIVNKLLLHMTRRNTLFKLKFEDGLPKQYSTMVVIPTLLKNCGKVKEMFDNLEVCYLSNKSNNMYFTLLGDCSNEVVKKTDEDSLIVEAGLNKVSELNEKYGKEIFHFVYRNRFYNKGEESFIGYERKRGALLHFNKLILGKLSKKEKEEYFNCHTFNNFKVPIKYVITLDSDTKLVLNTALKLIGCMAHPMNKPVLSEDGKKVISGYGIMQPRISIDAPVTNKSCYSQLFAGLGGLDIYVTASYDVYQDTFDEGIYTGKGIYDLEVYDKVLSGTFPDNLILSHDLIEGSYLRCGFINDVELFDDYPASYLKDATRHHRWNRGDFQISGWLKKKVKNQKNEEVDNPINFLSKWKIFDNLRRSLVSVFLLLVTFYGFIFGDVHVFYYFIFDLVIIASPIVFYLLSRFIYRNKHDRFLKYYLALVRGIISVVNKSFILLTILPYEAYLYVDSMVKALYRMLISKKKLLNWITSEEIEKTLKGDLKTYIINFKVNYFFAVMIILVAFIFNPDNLLLAGVLALFWFLAPILMWYIGKKIIVKNKELKDDEKLEIKDIAIQTWKYFDDFMVEDSNYLIPDNYQYNRSLKADYRTSPTNIGFSLVSIISASELDLINKNMAVKRITDVIRTVERLEKWNGHLFNWYNIYTLEKLPNYFISTVDNGNFISALYVVKGFLEKYGNDNILGRVEKLIVEMDFTKLYNPDLEVFSVGYNYSDKVLLKCHYNNFASEARLTSFVAISKGDVPYKHWFCLDKTLTKYKGYKGVVSWSGTAFEYFMPLIFMKTYNHTLLDETYYFAYYTNKEFMKDIDKSLPWGMSESAYNELDDSNSYKYNAFGNPYLMLQDNVSYPIVISPYSSLMAIDINDDDVYENISKLKKLNMYGEYGFYESYDNDDKAVVKSYYAHHQGMILASLTNYLKKDVIRNYFHADKKIEAYEMLLKEKVQIEIFIDKTKTKYHQYNYNKESFENDVREYDKINDISEYGVLSNGYYSIILNELGIGFSKYKNLQINRYRKIPTEDYGLFMYIKNLNTGNLWSNTYAPMNVFNDSYKSIFASDRIKYIREDDSIVTTTEVTVVKDHNAELRKITFTNNTNEDVFLELTSYGEVIMCRNEEDIAHRAFNSVIIHSEIDEDTSSLIFTRKSKTKENTKYYVINRMFLDEEDDSFEYETSRVNFIGRNRNASNPIALEGNLSKTVGASIDPIMSIRKNIKIKAKDEKNVYLLVGFGKSREQVLEIVDAYKDEFSVEKAFDMTTVYNHMMTSYTNVSASQKRLYNEILKYIYSAIPNSLGRIDLLNKNKLSRVNLWKTGISGDLPIITVSIDKIEDLGFIDEVLKIYEYFKSKSIYLDVAIIDNEDFSKETPILNYINRAMYRINNLNYFENTLGNVYTISSYDLSLEEKDLLKLVSKIYLNASSNKTLEEQVKRISLNIPEVNKLDINKSSVLKVDMLDNIDFYNGFGGFINGGKEYYIDKINTPTPWINVISNKGFGTVISNNLGGFSFSNNSREYKLTSWSNDTTYDPSSEKLIVNGFKFIPSYVKHGFGYSIFYSETLEYSIYVKVYVSLEKKVKFYDIKVINKLGFKQSIKFDLILDFVLGVTEELTSRYIVSSFDNNCLTVKNVYSNNFKDSKVFVTSTEKISASYDNKLNSKGITVNIDLNSNESKEFSFMFGSELIDYACEFDKVVDYWDKKLSVISVDTPDKSFNYVMNGWYLYQAYSSRLLAKAAFYQVGGATGFRDQLQDIMGVIYSDELFARNQILKQASHQFIEGDVLHWWHEELMFGARTRFSDDYLWLVYVTFEYLSKTLDYSILDEDVCFVTGDSLTKSESEKGISYSYSDSTDTLYNHLKLCITKALNQIGRHGLPLMGSGDWNDGMNKVGHKGRGESVFVGFFLYDILFKMSDISKFKKDNKFSKMCLDKRELLLSKLNKNAWDGQWYLRAFFDNGDPLGSRNNTECQIDLLSQSWSVLSDVCTPDRKESVYNSVESKLVDKDNKIIKLLTPSFKESKNNPGYIMDYISGTRENGGQYTHAALWYIMALLKDNKCLKAYEYYQMINPINRTLTEDSVFKYKTEPYVIAADIYSNKEIPGRGGWTWYTGSASWAYKIGLEHILGFQKKGDTLFINPKIDSSWPLFNIKYKYFDTVYLIRVNNLNHVSHGVLSVSVDGVMTDCIKLINDGVEHNVVVEMGEV